MSKSASLFLFFIFSNLDDPGFVFIPQGHILAQLVWPCVRKSPQARAVLYAPELLYSTFPGLHGHHTNKNPS